MGKKSEFSLDSGKLFRLVHKNLKMLIFITIIAGILSLVASLFMKNRFKSEAIIYPASYDDNKPYYDMKDRKAWFGQLFEVDHYIQIVNSEEVKDYIIKKYNLTVHYDLKPTDKYLQTKLTKAYFDNVQINRTHFQSIQVEVTDTDPVFAADMANDIVAMSDTILNRIMKDRAQKMVDLYQKQYEGYMAIMSSYADTLNMLGGKHGLSNVETQAQELTRGYASALIAGNTRVANELEKKMKEYGKFSGTYSKEFYLIMHNSQYMGELTRNLVNAKSEVESIIPYHFKFVVNQAKVSDKKASPKRSLIVIFSAISAFFLTIVLLIMQEYFAKLLKNKE